MILLVLERSEYDWLCVLVNLGFLLICLFMGFLFKTFNSCFSVLIIFQLEYFIYNILIYKLLLCLRCSNYCPFPPPPHFFILFSFLNKYLTIKMALFNQQKGFLYSCILLTLTIMLYAYVRTDRIFTYPSCPTLDLTHKLER